MKASTFVPRLACLFLGCLIVGMARAATNDISVQVENVSDMRSTASIYPRCQLQLRFSGGDVADAFGIYDVRITKALDDTGRDLLAGSDEGPKQRLFQEGGYSRQFTRAVEIATPSRTARTIKTLEGEAQLLYPTPVNGGMVIIKNFMPQPGQPLVDPALKQSNVSIVYLGPEASQTNSDDALPQQQPRRIPLGRRQGRGFGLNFSVDDPNHRLADMEFLDAYGRQMWMHFDSTNGKRTCWFQDTPPSNMQLFIYLATPESIKTIPFKIENIDLP